jgi:ligand-binding SRPBCC domain-containing protein
MTCIELSTIIPASPQICFDLSRSVNIHVSSMQHTKERVVRGKTEGIFELNDEVTWEACHFGITQQLTVTITQLQPYTFFEDKMVKGAFKSMVHQHYFEAINEGTVMKDVFIYQTPYGIFGWIFDTFILKRYMTKLLMQRNEHIKHFAKLVQAKK